jgi:hypothetical protein
VIRDDKVDEPLAKHQLDRDKANGDETGIDSKKAQKGLRPGSDQW